MERRYARAAKRLRRAAEILLHPREITPEAVDEEARPREHVVFARVHNELGRYAERAQCLVHLLTARDRDVEVLGAAEEEGGSADAVRMEERIGDLGPEREVAPRWTQLGVVLDDVLIGAVGRELVAAAGAAD